MLYAARGAARRARRRASRLADRGRDAGPPARPLGRLDPVRRVQARAQLFADSAVTHERLPFGIDRVTVGGTVVAVREEVVARTPFCTLRRFAKDLPGPSPPGATSPPC